MHFLQIWVMPSRTGVTPKYEQINVPREAKLGKLVLVGTNAEREGAIRIHQDANMYVTLLDSARAARGARARRRAVTRGCTSLVDRST